MLSLVFVTAFVLPTVLGNCCFPDQFSSVDYIVGDPRPITTVMDFKQKKHLERREGDDLDFKLTDFGNGVTYWKYKDGSCKRLNKILEEYHACLPPPSVAKLLSVGTLGSSLTTKTYGFGLVTFRVADGCVPILITEPIENKLTTRLITNFTPTADVSDFNLDLSACN